MRDFLQDATLLKTTLSKIQGIYNWLFRLYKLLSLRVHLHVLYEYTIIVFLKYLHTHVYYDITINIMTHNGKAIFLFNGIERAMEVRNPKAECTAFYVRIVITPPLPICNAKPAHFIKIITFICMCLCMYE